MAIENNITLKSQLRTGRQQRRISTTYIAMQIMEIMQNHIGVDAAISKDRLFVTLFMQKFNDDRLDHYLLWDFTKKAMHLLRSKSNCFIASNRIQDSFEYFVIKDMKDAKHYLEQLENSIVRMRAMQTKCYKAVKEKWWAKNWSIENKAIKRLK